MRLKLRILSLFILVSIGLIGLIFISRGASIEKILMGRVEIPIYLLTVTGSGLGSGTIIGSVGGINCTSTIGVESGICSAYIPSGTIVILTATAIPGNSFDGWTGSGCLGTGTCTIAMDGDKTVDASFGNIPFTGDLVAWYKINEGVGVIVANSANPTVVPTQKWPDLSIIGDAAYFWNHLPGFGSSIGTSYCEYANVASVLAQTVNDSFCLFVRKEGTIQAYPFNFGTSVFIGDPSAILSNAQWSVAGSRTVSLRIGGSAASHTGDLGVSFLNKWAFIFILNDGTQTRIRYIRDDGTRVTETAIGDTAAIPNFKRIRLFMDWDGIIGVNAYFYGNQADFMFWYNKKLAESDYAQVYDILRSRYGMAPRSGW